MEDAMKQLLWLCRRPRRGRRMLVFTADRPRRIDRVIDFFGDRRPGAAAVILRLTMSPQAKVCRD
jgi:hypothetical protein